MALFSDLDSARFYIHEEHGDGPAFPQNVDYPIAVFRA